MNNDCIVDDLTAQALNDHYAAISILHGPKLHHTEAEENCASCKFFHHGNNSLSHAGPSLTDSHWTKCSPCMVSAHLGHQYLWHRSLNCSTHPSWLASAAEGLRLILITPVLSQTLEFTYSQYIHITHMHRLPSGLSIGADF